MNQVVIDDIIPRTQIVSSSGQTVFNTNWTADQASDIVVYARAVGVVANDFTQVIDPSLYNVTFVGVSETTRVTFITGRVLNDVVTIVRNTPADRENLYINTNFTPSMLNQDFGLLTMIDQQAQMYDTIVNPRYNVSATITPQSMLGGGDVVLPILIANQTWVKDPDNFGFIPYLLPEGGGLAPNDATYLLQVANSELPNSQALGELASGFVVNTTATGVQLSRIFEDTTNQIVITNEDGIAGNPAFSLSPNVILPGVQGMGLIRGSTAQRPVTPGSNTFFRFNTDSEFLEYWDGTDWIEIIENAGILSITGTANQILVDNTDPANPILSTPQDIALTSSPTFNNLTLTSGLIYDTNGNIILGMVPNASSVNFVAIINQSTGNGPMVKAVGADTDVALLLASKGDEGINIYTGAITAPALRIQSGTGAQHITSFFFSDTVEHRSVTFQDASGTLAFLSDLPTLGTGVAAALAENVGSAGSFVVFNGAGGTPSSMTGTNITGTAAGLSVGFASTAGSATSASSVPLGGITGLGSGVATALAINVGSTGAFVTFNGAGGTPSSMTGTNITGTAAGLTAGIASAVALGGITGLGSGVATALAATLNGSGALSATTSPTFVTPVLGAAAATSINFGGGALANYIPVTLFGTAPTISFATPGDLTVSYVAATTNYSRIGSMVTVTMVIFFTPTYTTASGAIVVGTLPITSNASAGAAGSLSIAATTFPTGCTYAVALIAGSSTVVQIQGRGAGNVGAPFTATNFPSGVAASMVLTATYFV